MMRSKRRGWLDVKQNAALPDGRVGKANGNGWWRFPRRLVGHADGVVYDGETVVYNSTDILEIWKRHGRTRSRMGYDVSISTQELTKLERRERGKRTMYLVLRNGQYMDFLQASPCLTLEQAVKEVENLGGWIVETIPTKVELEAALELKS